MKYAAIAFASASLAAGAAAALPAEPTDMDYLRASRCRGIATGLGADASGFQAYLKTAARGRSLSVQDRGDQEFAKAKRQASGEAKTRLQAELSGACAAYAAPGQAAAG
jgi:hypothetical protein